MGRGQGSLITAAASPSQQRRLLRADPAERAGELFGPPTTYSSLPPYEDFLAAHRFTHHGLAVVRDEEWELMNGYGEGVSGRPHVSLAFRGNILAADTIVGYVERHVHNHHHEQVVDGRLVSYDARIRLKDESYRGRGFAAAWNAHLDQEYRQLGVHHHELTAVEIGAYLSATPDHYFHPHTYLAEGAARDFTIKQHQPGRIGAWAAKSLWEKYRGRAEYLRDSNIITRQQFQAFHRRFATNTELQSEKWRRRFIQPYQIAEWGQEDDFVTPEGETTWLGKYFLLGPQQRLNDHRYPSLGWFGVKFFQPSPSE